LQSHAGNSAKILTPFKMKFGCFAQTVPHLNKSNKKTQQPEIRLLRLKGGRDDWIRTSDLVVPNDARYRAALHPEFGAENIDLLNPSH
jgi:hypothetical protein